MEKCTEHQNQTGRSKAQETFVGVELISILYTGFSTFEIFNEPRI